MSSMDFTKLDQSRAVLSRVLVVEKQMLHLKLSTPNEIGAIASNGTVVWLPHGEATALESMGLLWRCQLLELCYGIQDKGRAKAMRLPGKPSSDKARREWGYTEGFRFIIMISPSSRGLLNISPTWSCLEL